MPALSGGSPVLNLRFSRFSRYLLEFVWLRCLFVGEVTDLLRLSSPLTLCILADRQCYVHEVRLCMLLAKRSASVYRQYLEDDAFALENVSI